MSKRVAGNRGVKARNFAHKKMPQQHLKMVKALRSQQAQIEYLQKHGKIDTERFDAAAELATIGGRIKQFFRMNRARG